jgi:hypothetical protein
MKTKFEMVYEFDRVLTYLMILKACRGYFQNPKAEGLFFVYHSLNGVTFNTEEAPTEDEC